MKKLGNRQRIAALILCTSNSVACGGDDAVTVRDVIVGGIWTGQLTRSNYVQTEVSTNAELRITSLSGSNCGTLSLSGTRCGSMTVICDRTVDLSGGQLANAGDRRYFTASLSSGTCNAYMEIYNTIGGPNGGRVGLAVTYQEIGAFRTKSFQGDLIHSGTSGSGTPGPCDPYADRIVSIVNTNRCDGYPQTVEGYRATCNEYVNNQATPAGCWPQYRAYLECQTSINACAQCREPGGTYDAFRRCFCARNPSVCL